MIRSLYIKFGLLLIWLSSITLHAEGEIPYVLVSVAPHRFFVKQIAGETVKVHLMVPAGASAHTYEPTPKQIITASSANIWFLIGEFFETRALQALKSYHPQLEVVDLKQGLDLIYAEHGHKKCCPGCIDLHIWLSARQAQIQAQTIANTLSKAYPMHAALYKENLAKLQEKLKSLDTQIISILSAIQNRTIFVSHPAYAYFCRDYNLCQQSIEIEGKDPSPQQMTKLLKLVQVLNVRTIFVQMQYNNKAAKLVADTIGAKLIVLDPYAEEFFTCMLEIAHAFATQ